jgi:esterase/lipase
MLNTLTRKKQNASHIFAKAGFERDLLSKHIICISGWGQKFDLLENNIFIKNCLNLTNFNNNEQCLIKSLNYSQFKNVDDFFSSISHLIQNTEFMTKDFCQKSRREMKTVDATASFPNGIFGEKTKSEIDILNQIGYTRDRPKILIGWSLGGQLALRIIEKKILIPDLLVLISTPFQMVQSLEIQDAMPIETFNKFRDELIKNPNSALKKFSALCAMNDKNASAIKRSLNIDEKNFENLLFWLDELKKFSCSNLDFSDVPRTLYFQGLGDAIVHKNQAKLFEKKIKKFQLYSFDKCGHAAHLSCV